MNPDSNIISTQNLALSERLLGWFHALDKVLAESNQRACVTLHGSREWSLQHIMQLPYKSRVLLSGDIQMEGAVNFSKAENLLGQEVECVIFDLHNGLDIDVLCLASGLIRAGGILLLLCPQDVTEIKDPYASWQGKAAHKAVFLTYLMDQLSRSPVSYSIRPEQPFPDIKPLALSPVVEIKNALSIDQCELMQQMKLWWGDTSKPLFLLTADRGRGKSTLLGRFASSLQGAGQIVVSAASRMQVEILLQQLDQHSSVGFMAPDEIIRRAQKIHTLIIDEAAMLPASMLQQCIELAQKTILATTTGGYEGTGQGFMLKFVASFNPQLYQSASLQQAIRWGQNDLLEQVFAQALILSSAPLKECPVDQEVVIEVLTKQQLVARLELLKTVYQLLVSAHYRSSPSDLRQLMEDDNQTVIIATTGSTLLGVLLLNQEGGFEPELSEQIFLGQRRPQGHLLAQMLTAQAGMKNFCAYRGYRVQRIAVEPGYRRRGLGRRLINRATQLVETQQLDYLGSSFALDADNAAFWKSCGFQLAHVSSGRGKSSGRQTVAVVQSSREPVVTDLSAMREKIQRDLPLWLLSYCQQMYWRDVVALLNLLDMQQELSQQDRDEVAAFAYGHRGLDYSQAALQRFLIQQYCNAVNDSDDTHRVLIEKILLNRGWSDILMHSAYAGRKPLLKNMRESIRKLYESKYEVRQSTR